MQGWGEGERGKPFPRGLKPEGLKPEGLRENIPRKTISAQRAGGMTESALARPFLIQSSQGGSGGGPQGAGGMTESALARPFFLLSSQGWGSGGEHRGLGGFFSRFWLSGGSKTAKDAKTRLAMTPCHATTRTPRLATTPRHASPRLSDRSRLDFRPQLGRPNPPKSVKNRSQDAVHFRLRFRIDFWTFLTPNFDPLDHKNLFL